MDKKTVFILVLIAGLVLSFVFRPSKTIDTYENEINNLKVLNKELALTNDSILSANGQLSIEIKELINTKLPIST